MRHIGSLASKSDAQRFTAFLLTEGIAAHTEEDGDQTWAIWVRDENGVDRARSELDDFRYEPNAERYQRVEQAAESIRRDEMKRREMARKNVVEMRSNWNRVKVKRRPLTIAMICLSIFVYIGSAQGQRLDSTIMRTLLFRDPIPPITQEFYRSEVSASTYEASLNLRKGEVWRVVTPIFIHFGIFHLAFNMYMLYYLGGMVENQLGTLKYSLIVLATAILPNAAQCMLPETWGGGIVSGGMSGVLFGLFGYIWMKMRYDPGKGLFLPQSTVMILMIWLLLGFVGALKVMFGMNVANWAHGIGFAVGVAIGYAPVLFKTR